MCFYLSIYLSILDFFSCLYYKNFLYQFLAKRIWAFLPYLKMTCKDIEAKGVHKISLLCKNVDNSDDMTSIDNKPAQTESLLHSQEQEDKL